MGCSYFDMNNYIYLINDEDNQNKENINYHRCRKSLRDVEKVEGKCLILCTFPGRVSFWRWRDYLSIQ